MRLVVSAGRQSLPGLLVCGGDLEERQDGLARGWFWRGHAYLERALGAVWIERRGANLDGHIWPGAAYGEVLN